MSRPSLPKSLKIFHLKISDKIYTNMKVDLLDALLSSAALYVVGSYLFWVNKTIITLTANSVFGRFQRQGSGR